MHTISKQEIIEEFINYHNTISSESTKGNYRSVLNCLLESSYPDITDTKVLNYVRGKSWKPNTKSRNIIVINRFLKFLYEKGYMTTDLSKVAPAPRRVSTFEFCPSDIQLERLFSAVETAFKQKWETKLYNCVFRLYAKTGMRRSELLNLNVEDLHFEDKKIIVRETKNKDDRPIPIDSALEGLLKDYLEYFSYESGPLFRGKMGRRLIRRSLSIAFTKVKRASGIPENFRLHGFRRYFANVLRRNGTDLGTIARLLGHREIKTTMGYFNVDDDEMMAAMESVRV